ncbi:MAG: hypothetical protein Q8R47_00310 [Nanoarchaeota archaeon]|nr:hypothetical protein [Nanoarchaeota archaeon]
MVLHFTKTLPEALENISSFGEGYELPIYSAEEVRSHLISDEVIADYGYAKWAIVDSLNEKYDALLFNKFDLYNWLEKNQDDEVAYFLNEAGSNSLNYSEYLAPSRFHLWLGKKGFVIGIEQKGKGFNAVKINDEKIKEHQGGAFQFFRNCKNVVFFDDPKEARMVYLEVRM